MVEPTPVVVGRLVAYVRAGGFPHVAAAANGVFQADWEEWQRQAAAGTSPYAEAIAAVETAHAEARLTAELAALRTAPIFWLRNGPGRHRLEKAGWSAPVKAQDMVNQEALREKIRIEVALDTLQTIKAILDVLDEEPHIKAKVAEALDKKGLSWKPTHPPPPASPTPRSS